MVPLTKGLIREFNYNGSNSYVGYTLSNQAWDGYNFTATINFPFPVSTPTFLGQFHNKSGFDSIDFLWHAESSGIVVHSGDMPDATSAEQNKYLWTIEPSISDLNISFAIKNVSTETYITSTVTENSHNSGAVTLSADATPLQYQTSTTDKCGTIYVWYIPSTGKYLSVNSVLDGAGSLMGVWSLAANHDGPSTGFHSYLDLITRYWGKNEMAAKLDNAGQYGYPALNNDYTVALNGVRTAIVGGSYTGNAANYNNLRTLYEGFLAAEYVKPADGTFIRIRSTLGAKAYLKAASAGSRMTVTTTEDKNIIFLYSGGKLIAYTHGIAINNVREIGTVGGDASSFTFVNAVNGNVGLSLAATYTNNTNYLYSTGVNGSNADRNTADSRFVNQNAFTIEDVTSLPVTMTPIGGRGYASFYAPVGISSLPEGVKAYIATLTTSRVQFEAIESIPAETAVVLYMPSCNAETTINLPIGTATANTDGNVLRGTVAATALGEQQVMTMQEVGNDLGFYKYNGTSLGGFKAYVNISDIPSSIKSFALDFDDDATAIEMVNGQWSMVNDQPIYNVAGQRISKMQKGINIVNGKKVMVK